MTTTPLAALPDLHRSELASVRIALSGDGRDPQDRYRRIDRAALRGLRAGLRVTEIAR